jgi:hypothetical protein
MVNNLANSALACNNLPLFYILIDLVIISYIIRRVAELTVHELLRHLELAHTHKRAHSAENELDLVLHFIPLHCCFSAKRSTQSGSTRRSIRSLPDQHLPA